MINREEYTLQRNNQDIGSSDLNYSLSEGERNALGLAFFLAQLPEDMSNNILVFDDPMTSFDTSRANITAKCIIQYSTKYTFILTHHRDFASKIFYYKKGNVFCLKLSKNDSNKTYLLNSKDFLEKDQFFKLYEKLLDSIEKKDLSKQRYLSRDVVELILTNAYLVTIKSIDKFTSQYEKVRLGKMQNNRNMSLLQEINNNKELSTQMKIFLEYYNWLSDENHSSNLSAIQMDDSELIPNLNKVFSDIKKYMQSWDYK